MPDHEGERKCLLASGSIASGYSVFAGRQNVFAGLLRTKLRGNHIMRRA